MACSILNRNLTRKEWETYLPSQMSGARSEGRPACPRVPGAWKSRPDRSLTARLRTGTALLPSAGAAAGSPSEGDRSTKSSHVAHRGLVGILVEQVEAVGEHAEARPAAHVNPEIICESGRVAEN